MKFILIGTSQLAISSLKALLYSNAQVQAIISIVKKLRPNNSVDFSNFARKNGIHYHEVDDINSIETIKMVSKYEPDYIFIQWPKIIKNGLLNLPKYFCIGTHPTDLPFNRGRHPIHWIISSGISRTKVSFFKMDSGIDTGNILFQVPFKIEFGDDINDVNEKMNISTYKGMKKLYQKLIVNNTYSGEKQNYGLSNYWRKKTPHDVTIDLRMPADLIARIVLSFTVPYPCAKLIFKDNIIKICKVKILKKKFNKEELQRLEPGKIISIKGKIVVAKASDEIIALECVNEFPKEFLSEKYIHPPTKYFQEYNIELDKKY